MKSTSPSRRQVQHSSFIGPVSGCGTQQTGTFVDLPSATVSEVLFLFERAKLVLVSFARGCCHSCTLLLKFTPTIPPLSKPFVGHAANRKHTGASKLCNSACHFCSLQLEPVLMRQGTLALEFLVRCISILIPSTARARPLPHVVTTGACSWTWTRSWT